MRLGEPATLRAISRLVRSPQPRPLRRDLRRVQLMRSFNTAVNSVESRTTMFSNQDKLPRLPVPDLEKSLEAYVGSLVPLLEQKVRHARPGPADGSSTPAVPFRKRSRSERSSRGILQLKAV